MKVTDAAGGQGDFFREDMRSWQQLSRVSPYVMPVVDAVKWEGLWCILMERQEDADPKHPENV